MERRRIDADVALKDIRSGMTDAELMAKYRLSAKGLQSLFNKLLLAGLIEIEELDLRMPTFMGTMFVSQIVYPPAADGKSDVGDSTAGNPPSEMKLTTVMKDIRLGATDSELMEKYHLSARGLQSLLEHLVFSGIIKQVEVDQRLTSVDSTVDVNGLRKRFTAKCSDHATRKPHAHRRQCPACGRPQEAEMDECPACGVIMSKYKDKAEREHESLV